MLVSPLHNTSGHIYVSGEITNTHTQCKNTTPLDTNYYFCPVGSISQNGYFAIRFCQELQLRGLICPWSCKGPWIDPPFEFKRPQSIHFHIIFKQRMDSNLI